MPQQPHPGDAYSNIPPSQPQPWTGADGQPLPPPPTSSAASGGAKDNRVRLIAAGAAVLAVLVIGVVGYTVWDTFVREDSGVAACKAMSEGRQPDGSDDAGEDAKLTEAQYREARKVFEDSRHEKIREHGTALMDIVWQVDQLDDEEALGALAFMGPLGTHMSGLQTACADQGVIVNLNKD
ncbi:hypothetical protein GCM10011608_48830 [Micromonospora sonchi]|uniref:Uncharacterized protein n=2 Tax=Micromonospora sonchi TaxID=1763543 RepID=A0A917U599_9ACTN|nr:hypothetical protein GCM10011608_48830 [Micromonospora sonchi]